MYVPKPNEVKEKWGLDEVLYVEDLEKYLETKKPVKNN